MEHIYCGHINGEQLKNSTSGGIAYAIGKQIISSGGVVYGVGYSSDFKSVEYFRVVSEHNLSIISGTKYIRCTISKHTLENIVIDLNERIVCFVGLPCGVALVRKHIQEKHPHLLHNLICIDLICHGPTYPSVLKSFIEEIEKKYSGKVIEFSNRFKYPNWKPTYLMVRFDNGKQYIKPLYDTDFGYALTVYTMSSCYSCKIKGNNRYSDITIGDGWGVPETSLGYSKFGTSIVITHSENGDDIINHLSSQTDTVLEPVQQFDLERYNPMYYYSATKHKDYDKFKDMYEKYGLMKSCNKSRDIKQIIRSKIPLWLLNLLTHSN